MDEELKIFTEKLEETLEEELTKEYPNPKVLSVFERMQIITIKSGIDVENIIST